MMPPELLKREDGQKYNLFLTVDPKTRAAGEAHTRLSRTTWGSVNLAQTKGLMGQHKPAEVIKSVHHELLHQVIGVNVSRDQLQPISDLIQSSPQLYAPIIKRVQSEVPDASQTLIAEEVMTYIASDYLVDPVKTQRKYPEMTTRISSLLPLKKKDAAMLTTAPTGQQVQKPQLPQSINQTMTNMVISTMPLAPAVVLPTLSKAVSQQQAEQIMPKLQQAQTAYQRKDIPRAQQLITQAATMVQTDIQDPVKAEQIMTQLNTMVLDHKVEMAMKDQMPIIRVDSTQDAMKVQMKLAQSTQKPLYGITSAMVNGQETVVFKPIDVERSIQAGQEVFRSDAKPVPLREIRRQKGILLANSEQYELQPHKQEHRDLLKEFKNEFDSMVPFNKILTSKVNFDTTAMGQDVARLNTLMQLSSVEGVNAVRVVDWDGKQNVFEVVEVGGKQVLLISKDIATDRERLQHRNERRSGAG
jgi:hypothetical protein